MLLTSNQVMALNNRPVHLFVFVALAIIAAFFFSIVGWQFNAAAWPAGQQDTEYQTRMNGVVKRGETELRDLAFKMRWE